MHNWSDHNFSLCCDHTHRVTSPVLFTQTSPGSEVHLRFTVWHFLCLQEGLQMLVQIRCQKTPLQQIRVWSVSPSFCLSRFNRQEVMSTWCQLVGFIFSLSELHDGMGFFSRLSSSRGTRTAFAVPNVGRVWSRPLRRRKMEKSIAKVSLIGFETPDLNGQRS